MELTEQRLREHPVDSLQDILSPYRQGDCPLQILYKTASAEGKIQFSRDWYINPEDELLHKLRDNYGNSAVQLQYA